jgi:ChaB./Rho termination factor, N-terminal domain.
MPGQEELPSTLRRSPKKAQDTWIKTHDSAVQTYGEGRRAHQTAFAALKHSFEKVGDHWEPKERKGPSDPRAAMGRPGETAPPTAEGVDVNASRNHLLDVARRLDIPGTSRMSKQDLVTAIEKANRRQTRAKQPSAQRRRSSARAR